MMNSTPNFSSPARAVGELIVRVTTARGAIPIEGAQVDVRAFERESEGEARGALIASLITNRDGNTERILLPTEPRAQSLRPGNGTPYTVYNVEVHEEGYYSQSYVGVPIFEGILAVQPADLIPLPENGRTDGRTPDGERFFEAVPNQSRLDG